MSKFIILCLAVVVACEAGLIPSQLSYPDFPNLRTVHHGHGATSYQNVQMQNFGSVAIPKDLQVDDGNEYRHSQYLHQDVDDTHEISSLGLQNYANEHFVVSTEDPYTFDEHVEQVEHVEPEREHHHYVASDFEHYDHEADYEYH